MKKTTLFKSMLLLCALVVGSSSLWADTAGFALSAAPSKTISSKTLTCSIIGSASETWSISGTYSKASDPAPTFSWQSNSGDPALQIGSSKNGMGELTISTSGISGTITSIVVRCASASGNSNVSCTVGGSEFGTQSQASGSWTTLNDVTFSGEASGAIVITMSGTMAKYITSVSVTYTSGGGSDPSIDVTPTSKTENYDTEEGTFTVTLNKIDTGVGTEVVFYESDGTTPAVSNPYDWFDASINGDGNVAYTLTENTDLVNSRTAYFKVYGLAEESGDDVYSDLISLTQSKYTVDFATLPFEFDGDNSDVASTTGLTQSGLGKYDSSPKLKFDTTGDELILKIKGHLPQQLSFYIKGNGFSGGTFKVQWSANGTDYTDLATYSSSITDGTKEISLTSCTGLKYIKWVYTTKSSGNVALGSIAVSQQTVAITPAKTYTTYVTTKALDFSAVSDDIKAYVAASTASAGSITFTGKDAVPAGTPLLIKTTSAGATVNVPVIASADAVGTNYLEAGLGVENPITYDESASHFYYILTNGEFKQANNSPVATTKAYLSLPSKVSANELTINFDDEAGDVTGIATVSSKKQNNGEYYNLNGQRVDANHKGIVIVNGKKFFNK